MALLRPFKTVFEGKFFHDRDTERPESVLVKGIYEASFYLGLSRFPAGARGAAWDYEFACILGGMLRSTVGFIERGRTSAGLSNPGFGTEQTHT